jgi:hypothetical protein
MQENCPGAGYAGELSKKDVGIHKPCQNEHQINRDILYFLPVATKNFNLEIFKFYFDRNSAINFLQF